MISDTPVDIADAGLNPPDAHVISQLKLISRGDVCPAELLPWVQLLPPEETARFRSDLQLVLSEPLTTGEELDWNEILIILHEYSAIAGWEGGLACLATASKPQALYEVEVRSIDLRDLESASPAVRQAANEALEQFLPFHPTSAARLERGHLKKMANREVWQIDLPDGYRLRFLVAEPERTVHVVYLGPHPDGSAQGREQAIRAAVQRRRHGG